MVRHPADEERAEGRHAAERPRREFRLLLLHRLFAGLGVEVPEPWRWAKPADLETGLGTDGAVQYAMAAGIGPWSCSATFQSTQPSSPLGPSWYIGDVYQAVATPDGPMIVGGAGGGDLFDYDDDDDSYTPNEETPTYATLTGTNDDGLAYRRKDGTALTFDAGGMLTAKTDSTGRQTAYTFQYDGRVGRYGLWPG